MSSRMTLILSKIYDLFDMVYGYYLWNAVQIRPISPYIIGGSRPTPTGELCPI
nr:MAG TPA: hypothetical protein [Caudoviricetes sp.]